MNKLIDMNKTLIWILAAVITLLAVYFQRKTGPTYPKRISFKVENTEYDLKLLRSHGGESDAILEFEIDDESVNGTIKYRKFPTNNEWITERMERSGNMLKAKLPHQPPAGKIEYFVEFHDADKNKLYSDSKATVIRFKGDVPNLYLIPHIIIMFIAMFFSNAAGLLAFFYKPFRNIGIITFFMILVGGMILGPVVQWFAFGDAWTGVPYGWDLTDNKTLIAFLVWLIALFRMKSKSGRTWIIAAAIVMIAIYTIPHSMFGSELDHTTGEVIQG